MAQLVYGVSMSVRIVLVRRLLSVLSSQHRIALVALLVILGIVVALGSYALLIQRERGRLLGELVARAALERVLDTAQAVSLVVFDDSQFHDRVRRAQQAQNRCSQALTALFTGLGAAIGAVGVLFGLTSVSWPLLPVAVVALLPVAVASRLNSDDEYFFMTTLMPAERRRFYLESLLVDRQPAKEIRAFDLSPFVRSLHGRLLDERIEGLRVLAKRRMRRLLLSSVIASIGSAVIAAVLVFLYLTGGMSLTTVGAAIFGFTMLKGQLRTLSGSAANLYESLLFVAELDDFVKDAANRSPADENTPTHTAPPQFQGVRMEDVVFTYPTATRPALHCVSLHVEPGEMVAFVGPNGSGKTTAAKLLAGLYEPESGRIFCGDADRSTLDRAVVRDQVAIGFQDFERFRLSIADNIAVGRHERRHIRNAILAAAERAGADTFVAKLPSGFDTTLGPEFEGGEELSQGQWQRLALARVFFREAELVILDEPTAALDALAEYELFETMRHGLEGRSAVVISHRLATVRCADRIYVFERGQVVEAGSHEDLVARGGLYARMYDVQASAYAVGTGPGSLKSLAV